jgi:hypothetical protein
MIGSYLAGEVVEGLFSALMRAISQVLCFDSFRKMCRRHTETMRRMMRPKMALNAEAAKGKVESNS